MCFTFAQIDTALVALGLLGKITATTRRTRHSTQVETSIIVTQRVKWCGISVCGFAGVTGAEAIELQ